MPWHTPPVSKVFQRCPQSQAQRSSLRGDQPQSGHRMRGPEGSRLFSWSGSRSKTTDDLAASSERTHMLQPVLGLASFSFNRAGRSSCNSFQVCRERRFRYRPHKTGAMFVRPSGANRKVPCARRPNTLPRSPLCLGEHSRRSVNWITTVGRVKGGNSDPHPIHNSQNSAWFSGTWAVFISL